MDDQPRTILEDFESYYKALLARNVCGPEVLITAAILTLTDWMYDR